MIAKYLEKFLYNFLSIVEAKNFSGKNGTKRI